MFPTTEFFTPVKMLCRQTVHKYRLLSFKLIFKLGRTYLSKKSSELQPKLNTIFGIVKSLVSRNYY